MKQKKHPPSKHPSAAVQQFDELPDTALVNFATGGTILNRSHASMYRHVKKGELEIVKVGNASKLRVGQIRRMLGASE